MSLVLHVSFSMWSRSTHSYFTGISDVYRFHSLYAVEKVVEPFSNGVVVFGFQLK